MVEEHVKQLLNQYQDHEQYDDDEDCLQASGEEGFFRHGVYLWIESAAPGGGDE